jgi:hypothetical protein
MHLTLNPLSYYTINIILVSNVAKQFGLDGCHIVGVNMFDQLFGSKTRVKLMKLFLENPEQRFYVRELTRLTDSLINSIRRELENLMTLELIIMQEEELEEEAKGIMKAKKYYSLNKNNIFHKELIDLFSKGKILSEKRFLERIQEAGTVLYMSLGGIFTEDSKAESDLLVIGDLDLGKAKQILNEFEVQFNKPIRYTIMDQGEYHVRRDIDDKFLLGIIYNKKNIVLINNLINNLSEGEREAEENENCA